MNANPPPSNAPSGSRLGLIAVVAIILILLAGVAGYLPRLQARQELVRQQRELAVPTVTVISPTPGKAPVAMALPAELRALTETAVYARASGYLKRWLVDMGDQVETGQLLAEIDTPELDQELAQSRAMVNQTDASLVLSLATAARWEELFKTASVSRQEVEEKQADLALKVATVEAARANVRRLEEMKGFARITAPFAGRITARLTDVGRLVTASGGTELFRLSQMRTLRVFVRVPQSLARAITLHQTAELTVSELPGRSFAASVVRTAGSMDAASRTLLTELEVPNERGELMAGGFGQVRFTDAKPDAVLTIPSNALIFQASGPQAGIVGADSKVSLRRITLGRDFGTTIEVLAGLDLKDRVILNPSDSLTDGAVVRLAQASPEAGKK
ncbi:MAG: efflux RND transporter periplasmic adaptor subunit [Verrucomicrobiota bacterium]